MNEINKPSVSEYSLNCQLKSYVPCSYEIKSINVIVPVPSSLNVITSSGVSILLHESAVINAFNVASSRIEVIVNVFDFETLGLFALVAVTTTSPTW